MKRAFRRDIKRSMGKSKTRFLSIMAIITLSTGFFAGIKATCPDMVLTANTFYKEQNLMDMKYMSTFGVAQEDIEKIRGDSAVETAEGAYTKDLFARTQNSDWTVRVHSIGEKINRLELVKGRLPERADECVVLNNYQSTESLLNTEITLHMNSKDEKIEDTLSITQLKVVGVVGSPMYVHGDIGNTTIGNGSLDTAIFVPAEAFSSEYFTEMYIKSAPAKSLQAYTEEYESTIETESERLEGKVLEAVKVRFDKLVKEINDELNDGQKELDKAKKETYSELEKAKAELEKAEAALEEGRAQYQEGVDLYYSEIKKAEQDLLDGESQLADGEAQLEEAQAGLNRIKQLTENPPVWDGQLPSQAIAVIEQTALIDPQLPDLIYRTLAGEEVEMTSQQRVIVEQITGEIYTGIREQISVQYAELLEQLDQVASGLSSLMLEYILTGSPSYKAQIDGIVAGAQGEIDTQKAVLKQAKQDLVIGGQTLERERVKGLEELEAAKGKLTEAETLIAQGYQEYSEGLKLAQEEFQKAQEELDKGKKELEELDEPELYSFTRSANNGYDSFYEDSQKIDAIAKVFPIFFILVAALICFTTMTRMVEEERTQIGTLKALGYSGVTIASKYFVYGIVASLVGSILGLTVGFQLFPKIIYGAYSSMYITPPVMAPFRWDYAIGCTVVAILVTSGAVLMASYRELAGTPSYLMRPKPPKSGKRVLLERVEFIWSHLSFTHKVTVRNLFRYKGRVILTVVGIAGCTALMLAGFGIRDSINAVVDRQFGNVWLYHSNLLGRDDLETKDREKLVEDIKSVDGVKELLVTNSKNITLKKDDKEQTAEMRAVVGDAASLGDFVVFKDRETNRRYELTDQGVILTEKAGRVLGVQVGDTVKIDNGDVARKEVKVTAITENYAFHYIYMTEKLYEELYGEKPSPSVLLINFTEDIQGEEEQKQVLSELLEVENVLGGGLTSQIFTTFSDMMGSLNYIVLVLIVCAGALAFVVLYNLTNINVAERVRELATIKVLGFYDKEVTAYIYRENVVCSILGVAVGLLMGVILHQFVIVTAEVDMVMFGREILPLSFVYASILTILFSTIVNIVLHFKLKKINMVESLKSVE